MIVFVEVMELNLQSYITSTLDGGAKLRHQFGLPPHEELLIEIEDQADGRELPMVDLKNL